MKRSFFAIVCLGLCLAPAVADTPRYPEIHVMRRTSFINAEAVPDHTIVVFGADDEVLIVEDGVPLDYDEIVAVPRSLASGERVKSLDLRALVKSGVVKPLRVLPPYDNLVQEFDDTLCNEAISYAVIAVADGRLVLSPAKKLLEYNNGREVDKEYIPAPVVRKYRRTASAAAVTATSSVSDDYFPDRYHPLMAFDGVPDTGWAEGASGPGLGESVTVEFAHPVTVDKINFLPGWFQAAYFKKNNRIKTMEIVLDDFRTTVNFADAMTSQGVSFASRPGKTVTFRKAQFIIREVYPGTAWDDTPLAEIGFLLNNEPILVDCGNIQTRVSLFPQD